MLKEIAAAEKARVRYGKLKEQSDRLLMNLNIRTEKLRPRTAVRNTEEEDDVDHDSDHSQQPPTEIIRCDPSDLTNVARTHPDGTIFVVCRPCDQSEDDNIFTEFQQAASSVALRKDSSHRFVKFKRAMCVCGKCDGPEARLVGPLRSVGMLLRRTSSVVALRKGGLIGMWQDTNSVKLEDFIRKYV